MQNPQTEPPTLGTHKGFEVYPMPMFARVPCADLTASIAWYEEALGFAAMFVMPGADGPVMAHVRRRKYQDILLVPAPPDASAGTLQLTFDASPEVDALHERATAAAPTGRRDIDPPADTPWGTRELRVRDPDGHHLAFTQRNHDSKSHEAMARAFAQDRGTE